MWWFRVQYLDPSGAVVMEDANEIHIPVGRPVVLELESADVIHSFWVPHLSGKKDMIPGRRTLLRIEADRAGEFGGVCAEYCGRQHALMGFVAVAHEDGNFREWYAERTDRHVSAGRGITTPEEPLSASMTDASEQSADLRPDAGADANSDQLSGQQLFMQSGCAACHRVARTEANGLAGPDLTHVGSRRTLGAGILPNNRGTLIGWIGDSQSLKPGNRMPSYDMLNAEELEAIAIWLEQQK
jgi:cytochrome c oxidase subunit 2